MSKAYRIQAITESTIREMTRLAIQHNAINLSQGYPDFSAPAALKEAAVAAIRGDFNQYSFTWGYAPLRQKLAEIYTARLGWQVDPDQHVVVTCGVTEAISAAFLAVLNPGDQVILFDPAHESMRPSAIFAGAEPVSVVLEGPDYRLDPDRLAAAITPRSKALLLNTPHNPSGRVFDAAELAIIADAAQQHDLILITDEIYDRILYDGRQHRCPGSLEALRARTLTLGGLSKTFAITGWRLGYAIGPDALAAAIKPAHDFLTICAPTPLQVAAVTALDFPDSYYTEMSAAYHQRREVMMAILEEIGFLAPRPEGAYYVLADYSSLPIPQARWDSLRFARWLTTEIGVAVVPGTVFYGQPGHGQHTVRFAFPKQIETLHEAGRRLGRLRLD
ncbi:MAG: aminotransferase class I/II-fold pyridoxal phosphate-dependent enzyme [Caldilineales bacterium]|nr:aminotransferase class I/II-fold pyridoxal phosphate-dependent enzyme [Caldilineales bacterium]